MNAIGDKILVISVKKCSVHLCIAGWRMCSKSNELQMDEREFTIVTVGDKLSKKTELLYKYTCNKEFYQYLMPDRFVSNVREIIVDYITYSVNFIDAESDDDYTMLRWSEYEKADVVIFCYSLANRSTFESVTRKWVADVRRIRHDVPCILVATDTEERGMKHRKKRMVTTAEGEDLKFTINAYALVECSVEKCVGIDDVFIEAVRSTYFENSF